MRLVGLDADGPTDAALLVAVALGDEDACRAFVDRHSSRVFGLALSVCRDRSLAEDVAQRAFEQTWRHAASYDPDRASARTWLLTITRRLAIDEVRRRRPIPLGPDDLAAALAPSGSDTERTGLEAMERDRVAAALAELPESQRRAVVFAALGGRSASEIAEIEGIPLGTAKTRVRLGLRRLRAGLSGERNHD
jgi:RNA polymerase sigma-70 factor (ECF subfamily)